MNAGTFCSICCSMASRSGCSGHLLKLVLVKLVTFSLLAKFVIDYVNAPTVQYCLSICFCKQTATLKVMVFLPGLCYSTLKSNMNPPPLKKKNKRKLCIPMDNRYLPNKDLCSFELISG